jgi:hypothetical protein
MSENMKMEDSERSNQVHPDARAQILQGMYKHYFEMAMDHHTKAATTSSFLLIIVGAIISFVRLDASIGGGLDLVSGLAVFVIGLFGAAWTWKQHERYYFWQHIAYEYQNELKKIVPELQTGEAYYGGAEDAAVEKYTSLFAKSIHERWLWVSLHGIVAAIGLGLMALAA